MMGTSKGMPIMQTAVFKFTTEMLCATGFLHDPPVKGPNIIPEGYLPGWGMMEDSQRCPSSCILILPECSKRTVEILVPDPQMPSLPPMWTPLPHPSPLLAPSHLAVGWHWAGGCPEQLPQWQGSGLRRIRAPAQEARKMAWWWSPAG